MVLGWATLRRVLDIQWWAMLVPLAAAGFIAGAGWRVMTAGVIGANIGAGFVVFFGGPIVLVLLVWALALAVYLLSGADHAKNSPSSRTATESMPGHTSRSAAESCVALLEKLCIRMQAKPTFC
jgi:uncharacterized membrane protein